MERIRVKIPKVNEPGEFWNYEFEGPNAQSDANALIASQSAKPGRGQAVIIRPEDDANWRDDIIKEKRRNEYPTDLEVIEALIEEAEGRPEKLTEVMMKRNEIKLKYPKERALR